MHYAIRLLQRGLGLEEIEKEDNFFLVKAAFVIAAIGMILRIVFWAYTQRYWEDALITCLHSENMASGFGLTHVRPGEAPLHGFTSPLSVLVPLIGDLMKVGFGLEFLKLVSIPASALTVFYMLGICRHKQVNLSAPLTIVAMTFVAVEHHQILWGMAGMETQLAVLILVMSVYYTMTLNPIRLGLSLGLCMLVRPDYAFWTIIVGIYVLARQPKVFLQVVGIAVAVYLPWILFTKLYYGSPLPNTIVAKGLGYSNWWLGEESIDFHTIKRRTWVMLSEQLHVHLGPMFAGHGAGLKVFFTTGTESPIANGMFFFAVVGTLMIAFKRNWVLWPLVALVVTYSLYYIFLVPVVFGWYKMPYIAILLILCLWGIQCATGLIKNTTWRGRIETTYAVVYLGVFIAVLPFTFYTERMIQQYVENDLRKAAGLYIRDHIKPDQAVGCEPLGYMGYYSRANIYDWPGLASRTVVAWSKEQPPERRSLENMLNDLRPEYLFLRDFEVQRSAESLAWIREDYHVVKVYQLDPEVGPTIPWIDRNMDTVFRIYKKNRLEDETPYDRSLFPTVADWSSDPAK